MLYILTKRISPLHDQQKGSSSGPRVKINEQILRVQPSDMKCQLLCGDGGVNLNIEAGFSLCCIAKDFDAIFGSSLLASFACNLVLGSLTIFSSANVLFITSNSSVQARTVLHLCFALLYGEFKIYKNCCSKL